MFTYDINITTAFVGISSAIAFYILVVRLADRTKAAEGKAAAAEREIVELREAHAAHVGAFALYREQAARDLCSRETISEVEARVSSHIRDVEQRVTRTIEGLGMRIDRLVKLADKDD